MNKESILFLKGLANEIELGYKWYSWIKLGQEPLMIFKITSCFLVFGFKISAFLMFCKKVAHLFVNGATLYKGP
jgi:hypothetical protein